MSKFERPISSTQLNLVGKVYGSAPVQGEGTINGYPFYFRARHDEWTFSISENAEVDPVDIQLIETGKKHGFFKKEPYGDEGGELAGYLEFSEAEQFIFACCRAYLKEKDIG